MDRTCARVDDWKQDLRCDFMCVCDNCRTQLQKGGHQVGVSEDLLVRNRDQIHRDRPLWLRGVGN